METGKMSGNRKEYCNITLTVIYLLLVITLLYSWKDRTQITMLLVFLGFGAFLLAAAVVLINRFSEICGKRWVQEYLKNSEMAPSEPEPKM